MRFYTGEAIRRSIRLMALILTHLSPLHPAERDPAKRDRRNLSGASCRLAFTKTLCQVGGEPSTRYAKPTASFGNRTSFAR